MVSSRISGLSAGGGSGWVVSMAAPAIRPSRNAVARSASSMMPPRAVLTTIGRRAMARNSAMAIIPRVAGVSGQCRVSTSADASTSSHGVYRGPRPLTPLWAANITVIPKARASAATP